MSAEGSKVVLTPSAFATLKNDFILKNNNVIFIFANHPTIFFADGHALEFLVHKNELHLSFYSI